MHCDLTLCDLTLCDLTLCDLTLCDLTLCDLTLCDLTLCLQTGDALCKMMVEHYEKLSAAKMAKLELKRARRPAPFFQPKFIADANGTNMRG